MHELGLTLEIVDAVCNRAEGRRVRSVELQIGKLTAVMPDAVRFAFDACVRGTVADGARLNIVEPAASARCLDCGRTSRFEEPFGLCPCGSANLEWLTGHELKITTMEVDEHV